MKDKIQELKEAFKKFRYGLAYLIAPDWIDDLTCTISVYRTNKINAMIREKYLQNTCEHCKYYVGCTKERENKNVSTEKL